MNTHRNTRRNTHSHTLYHLHVEFSSLQDINIRKYIYFWMHIFFKDLQKGASIKILTTRIHQSKEKRLLKLVMRFVLPSHSKNTKAYRSVCNDSPTTGNMSTSIFPGRQIEQKFHHLFPVDPQWLFFPFQVRQVSPTEIIKYMRKS